MKRKLIAALLGTSMLVVPAVVLAKEVVKSEQAETAEKANYDKLMKLSDDGFATLRDVRSARVAIFNGNPDQASKNVEAATMDLGKASADVKAYVGRTNGSKGADEWIPIDGTIDIADNFVLDAKKGEHVTKANEHFKKGEKQQAVEQLKLAEIDVNYTRLLMPVKATADHVEAAKKLIGEKKYYEANLALKAAEDGIVIDSVALVDIPKPADTKSPSPAPANTKPEASTTTK
ncbi:MAG: YfdX family protein [Hyphomicrobiaceae bacterium]|nr:YfdX family protein [Hyphomicrobiaceae bacterium]